MRRMGSESVTNGFGKPGIGWFGANRSSSNRISAAYCTVRVAVPMTPLKVAVMVVVPDDIAVARPELLIVATPVLLEFQVTEEVMSPNEPSE